MKKIIFFVRDILSAIYPNKCICCGELINEDNYLCSICNKKIERMNLDNICIDCGLDKNDCVCKYSVYRFAALVCVFKNMDYARKAYYSYKFSKKQHYVDFFANEMCYAINKCYKNVHFDFVCAVPSFKKFGYDHSGYIAKKISENLNIPLKNDLLFCVKKRKSQHKSSIKERLTNVDGKYSSNYRIDNMNVLLIDDIKTTGATVDECSKVLLYAGANRVYCATALCAVNLEKQKFEK